MAQDIKQDFMSGFLGELGKQRESKRKIEEQTSYARAWRQQTSKELTPLELSMFMLKNSTNLLISGAVTEEELKEAAVFVTQAMKAGGAGGLNAVSPVAPVTSPQGGVNPLAGLGQRLLQGTRSVAGLPATASGLPQASAGISGAVGTSLKNIGQRFAPRSRPAAAPARRPAPIASVKKFKSFNSVRAAEKANLPSGTIVLINGRRARID